MLYPQQYNGFPFYAISFFKRLKNVFLHAHSILMKFLCSLSQFEGQEIKLDSKVGIFITMNPGYAGRTELPESIKALFRPVTCISPDLELICLISLFSDGFLTAKILAKKMTVLYKLAREQLSKQFHYDWGLSC
jgi:hypothetical protein